MKFYESRKFVFLGIVAVISVVFVMRLFYLQVMDEAYKQFAEENILQKKIIYPSRGLIYGRNEKLLVGNEPVYDLMVTPSNVKNIDTAEFSRLLGIDEESFKKRMQKARNYSYYRPSIFLKQISLERYGRLQERSFEFRGFYFRPRTIRTYPEKTASHVVGYLGEVSQRDLNKADNNYQMGDYKGMSGLEKSYEEQLRGEKGVRHVLVDVLNREQGSYLDGALDKPAKSGNGLVTTLDVELQQYGEKLLKNKVGSMVAIQPQTGEVLAMVSSPTYDPNQLVGRKRADNFQKLMNDPYKPLFNRTITATYPPGSTFKPLMALLGLNEGVITPHWSINCPGGYFIRGLRVGCHKHKSPVDLNYSIEASCNTYYCHVFRRVLDQDQYTSIQPGYRNWRQNVAQFGFGKKLGIDLPNEKGGSLPHAEYFNGLYGERGWGSSTIISMGIGQGEISSTTLQMANFTAAIANRGHYYTPHLVKNIVTKNDTTQPNNYERYELNIDSAHFDPVIEGMHDVVEQGTAKWYGKVPGIEICGKTGTAQNPHGDDHSLFVAFAPKDDPQIAVGAIIENSGYGSVWAAPSNTLMIEKYLTDTIKRKRIERRILEADFIHKEDAEPQSIEN